jgi:hypothetical protein
VSLYINGDGSFTTAEAREIVTALTTLIEGLEALDSATRRYGMVSREIRGQAR